MKRRLFSAAMGSVLAAMCSLAWAATKLNSSKSNIYRLVYDTSIVSPAQASALLKGLEKLGRTSEAKAKAWLVSNFEPLGIPTASVKKVVILPADTTRKTITAILLKDPADEAQALAVSDEGASGPKKAKN